MSQKSRKTPQKPPKYITERIKVEKLIPGGQALGTLENGKKIFLWNALPGETVQDVEIWKEKSHFLEGVADTILKASPYRVPPQDDCYLSTSPWQIMTYDYELAEKRALLREIFRQQKIIFPDDDLLTNTASLDDSYDVLDCPLPELKTDGRDLFYRNKMEYALYFDHADELIHLAFHGRGSHRKIPLHSSSLERPEIFAAAQDIVRRLNREHEDARKYQSLPLRCNQAGEVSGGLYENHQPHPNFPALQDRVLGHTYSYSVNGFFQINLPVYELALQSIAEYISSDPVLDLYAGVGTIGLSVARTQKLTLVECDRSAFAELDANCKTILRASKAPETQITPVLAKSEEALNYIEPHQTVIFDPPRAGCRPELLSKILSVLPPTLIYLSCNPVTQARDLKILLEKYQIIKVQPFNFFPRTPHLENLVVMQRKDS